MLSGTYSSIFIATPVLADLKEREPQYKDLAAKVSRRLAGSRSGQRGDAGAGAVTAASAAAPAVPGAPVAVGPAVATDSPPGPEDQDTDVTAEQDAADGVAVPAAARTGDTPPRPVTRQQRVTGSAQRRPGARKKRR
jgi:preprotein translocase subunit SecF